MADIRLRSTLLITLLAAAAWPALAQTPSRMADAVWNPEEMAAARKELRHSTNTLFIGFDRLETQNSVGRNALAWDASGWYGGDINKLAITGEGEYDFSGQAEAEISALWLRTITTYFDLQAGIRYDIETNDLAHAVFGFRGLAPYWFEIDVAAFISHRGDISMQASAEYDWLLTQRLVLQADGGMEFSFSDAPQRNIGTGLADMHLGFNLRYEFQRNLAPYIGMEWRQEFGRAADHARENGEDPSQVMFVAGMRFWF